MPPRKSTKGKSKKPMVSNKVLEDEPIEEVIQKPKSTFPSIFAQAADQPDLSFLLTNNLSRLKAGLKELSDFLGRTPQQDGLACRFFEKIAQALAQLLDRLDDPDAEFDQPEALPSESSGRRTSARRAKPKASPKNPTPLPEGELSELASCQLLLAICLADSLRILPEPPHRFPLSQVFALMLQQFAYLGDAHDSVGFLGVSELVGVMELCDAFVLLVDLEDGQLLQELFTHTLEAIRGDTPEPLRRKLCKILVVCLEETADNIEPALLDGLLKPLMFSPSHSSHSKVRFVHQVMLQCESALHPSLYGLLQKMENFPDKFFELLNALHQVSPTFLLNFAPILEDQLQSHDATRKRVTELLVDIFTAPGDAVARHAPLFKSFCARFNDKNPEIRLIMIEQFSHPFLSKYPAYASLVGAELRQRSLDPLPEVRAAVIRVVSLLARENSPNFGDSDIVQITFQLLKGIQDRLRDTKSVVRDTALAELAQTFRFYLEKFGSSLVWDSSIRKAIGWIPAQILCLYFQPHSEIQNEVNAVLTQLLIQTNPAESNIFDHDSDDDDDDNEENDDDDDDEDNDDSTVEDDSEVEDVQKKKKTTLSLPQSPHLAYLNTLLSILFLLSDSPQREAAHAALFSMFRDRATFRFHIRSFLEDASVSSIPPVLLANASKEESEHFLALCRTLESDDSARDSLLNITSYATSYPEITQFLLESFSTSEEHNAFQHWYVRFLSRTTPILLHPEVVQDLSQYLFSLLADASSIDKRTLSVALFLANFLQELSGIAPELFGELFLDSSHLAKSLLKIHQAREARLNPLAQSLCRILANATDQKDFVPSRLSALTKLAGIFSDWCGALSSSASPDLLLARLSLRILVRVWDKPARYAKLVKESIALLRMPKPSVAVASQLRSGLAMQNLAIFAHHLPACLSQSDHDCIASSTSSYLQSLPSSKAAKPTFLDLRRWLLKYHYFQTLQQSSLTASQQFIATACPLLSLPDGYHTISLTAFNCLFRLLAEERNLDYFSVSSSSSSSTTTSNSSAFSITSLGIIAWSIPRTSLVLKEKILLHLYKYTKRYPVHALIAFFAFFAFESSNSMLGQKARQYFQNIILLRLKEHPSATSLRSLHFTFFHLLPILLANPNESDHDTVLSYFTRAMILVSNDKDLVKQSLARVVDLAEQFHLLGEVDPQPRLRLCSLAQGILHATPLSDHLRPSDYLKNYPESFIWFTLSAQPSSSSSSSVSSSLEDIPPLSELFAKIVQRGSAHTPRKPSSTPNAKRLRTPTKPSAQSSSRPTPSSSALASRTPLSRASKDRATARLLDLDQALPETNNQLVDDPSSSSSSSSSSSDSNQDSDEPKSDEDSPSKRQRTRSIRGFRTRH